ncbi:MAG: ArsR/SmtB family transcription factor [Candidatus Heimdallarchaeota archaeon]
MQITENLGQNPEIDSSLKLELVDSDTGSITIESDGKIELIAKALSSETRRSILHQIQIHQEGMDVSNIAANLNMTEANISAQIKKLEEAGLIDCDYCSGNHGVRKISKLKYCQISIKF